MDQNRFETAINRFKEYRDFVERQENSIIRSWYGTDFNEVKSPKHPREDFYKQEIDKAFQRAKVRLFPESIPFKDKKEEERSKKDLRYNNSADILETLIAFEGNLRDLRVLDIGCGSPILGNYLWSDFLPFVPEVLSELGADVCGIDYRPNPFAGYRHIAMDLYDFDANKLKRNLPYEHFDLIFGSSLSGGTVTPRNGQFLKGIGLQLVTNVLGNIKPKNSLLSLDRNLCEVGMSSLELLGYTHFCSGSINEFFISGY